MSKSNYVFHNSKSSAAINGNYVKNDQNTLDGSIIGRRIYIGSYESPYAEIIYFFTTNNNNKLIQRNNEEEEKIAEINSSRKLEDYFFNKFDYRIKIEFELLYLKKFQMLEKQKSVNNKTDGFLLLRYMLKVGVI